MSCLSTTWSPNSFQLRLAFNGRRSPVVFVRTRFPKLDRRIRTFSVAADSKQNGNAAEKPGNTWTNSNSSGDGLSGWSGADANEQSDDARGNSWSGGIVGAGIAGVILLAGLTFATLSLNKRSNSSLKQQMKPFTEQQETSLTFDDQDARVEEENAEGKYETRETSDLESRTGTYNSYAEKNEATTENSPDDEKNMVNLSTDDDVDNKASIQQDLHNDSAIGDISVAPEATPELPKSNTSGVSFVPSSSDDLDGVVVAETFEVKSESKENLLDSSVYNAHPTSELKEIEDSGFSLDSSSNSITHVSSEPLVTMDSQFDAVVEPKVVIEENIGIVSSVPTEDLGPRKTKDTFAKGNDSALEMDNLNGSASAGTTMVSAVANPFANEVDESSIDINESRSFLDSMNSGNLFTSAGIPAPSVVSAALQALPGKVLVPAVVDQVQGQALAALQVLKVIEADVQPGDLCSRREYARWLVAASSALSRNTVSKVYPAMYIENVTELAFDDITPEDPDFPSIQGLAEAGLISSKLSRHDMHSSLDEEGSPLRFSPEIPLSRQDLVSWKMALEKRQLPVADRKMLQQLSGFIDIDKINPDAWPALVADLSAGEQGITALAFGYTRLFQPDKPVTNAQAAIALATGEGSDIVSEELARIEAESMAEKAVTAHNALIAEVEKDVNANFEKELLLEREKIEAVEKLAEAARQELERLRIEREEENTSLMKERAAVEAEMEVLSRLRREVEEQLQTLMSNKVEISYEKERLNKLMKDAEIENQEIVRLQRELEVERKALSMARAWAEDEAKRAREQAKSLEEARDRWERKGLKVIVDQDLQEEANAGVTWLDAGKQFEIEGTVDRAENLVDTLKALAADVGGKSRDTIHKIVHKILSLIAILKEWAIKAGGQAMELKETASSKIGDSLQELQKGSVEFGSSVKEGAKRVAGDCREGVEKLTQKFKT